MRKIILAKKKQFFFLLAITMCLSSYAQNVNYVLSDDLDTIIVQWTFDRPFQQSGLSESSYPDNNGIADQSVGTWTQSVVSAGGANNQKGYRSVNGWDFSDENPRSYFLLPDITIPENFKELRINFYLRSGIGSPEAYNLEMKAGTGNWNLLQVLPIETVDTWTAFSVKTSVPNPVEKVSFRIRSHSTESIDSPYGLSPMGSGNLDEFQVIGRVETTGFNNFSEPEQICVLQKLLIINTGSTGSNIHVYNITGQRICTVSNVSKTAIELEKGIYIIHLQKGNHVINKKIIIQ